MGFLNYCENLSPFGGSSSPRWLREGAGWSAVPEVSVSRGEVG